MIIVWALIFPPPDSDTSPQGSAMSDLVRSHSITGCAQFDPTSWHSQRLVVGHEAALLALAQGRPAGPGSKTGRWLSGVFRHGINPPARVLLPKAPFKYACASGRE